MQSDSPKVVVIARTLLAAGREPLEERFSLREGGPGVTPRRLLELVPGAAALVADPSVRVDAELLEAAGEELELVANFAVGYDNVDLSACRERGVVVTNTPNVLTEATAELALALTLAASRRMGDAERDLRQGRWRGWDPAAYLGLELRGATVAVIGMGRIGRRYAELVTALGAEVVYASPSRKREAEKALGAERMELDAALSSAGVVSLHAPATSETHHLIGERELDLIGADGVLVNTSRGSLVDAEALATALREERLGAAGLDVYENEPELSPALLEAPCCVLLPHIGSATVRARRGMARLAAENVIAVLSGGEPKTPVS
jgi:glyoxylate reductase